MKNIINIPVALSVTGVVHIIRNQSINYLKLTLSPMSQFHKLATKIKTVIIILLMTMCAPHRWIIKSLKLIDINNKIIPCTKKAMSYWKTRMRIRTEGKIKQRENLKIQFRIFQGDWESTLIFCISLSPFTEKLNKLNTEYEEHTTKPKLSHLFHMDDLRLMGKTKEELQNRCK